MKKFYVALILAMSIFSFGAENWYVVAVNSIIQTGDGSYGNPWSHISQALTDGRVINGDIIHLSGTFTLTFDTGVVPYGEKSGLNVTKSLSFVGDSAESTIIQANILPEVSTNRVFYIGGGIQVTFENLTIKNGQGDPGGGIFANFSNISGKLTIKNCKITNNNQYNDTHFNTGYGGGGICVYGGNIVIDKSVNQR